MKLYQPAEIAKRYGLSVGYIRAACYRDQWNHPLPHLDIGTPKRHCPRIRAEAFEKWLSEEEALVSGVQ